MHKLAAALLLGRCLAGGAARADALEVVGFSADGGQVALLEHGVGEGSGLPWARFAVLDAKTGEPAREPIRVDLREGTEDDAVAEARRLGEEQREALQVEKWVPGSELAHDGDELRDKEGAPIGSLDLKARTRPGKCPAPYHPQLLRIVLRWLDDGATSVVLDEKRVPARRPCSAGCALDRLFGQGRTALLLLKCGAPAFEGHASRSWPVVARLPNAIAEDASAQ